MRVLAIGKSVPLFNSWEKVAGAARYTVDLQLPGMLHAKILRSPLHHARILNIDASRAERLPGVRAILTSQDVKPVKYAFTGRADQYPLPLEKVRYRGEELAAVAAVDEDTAEEAMGLIEVDYEELPPILEPEEALAEGSPLVHEDAPGNIVVRVFVERGDPEAAFAAADCLVEGRYVTQRVHQAYLEPAGCLAVWDPPGKVTVWTGSMNTSGIRSMLARVLDLPAGKVRVIQPHIGGSFGSKVRLWPFFPISAYLSRKTGGKPVRFVHSREEEYFGGRPREATVLYVSTAARKDGTLLGRKIRLIYDNGAYSEEGPNMMRNMSYRMDNLYRFPNTQVEAIGVYTTTTPIGAFRPWGSHQMIFALETQLDDLASELGMDPLELRLKNAPAAGDVTVHGWKFASCSLTDCLEKAADLVDWKQRRSESRKHHGLGLACAVHAGDWRFSGNFSGSNASLEIQEDGRILIVSGEAEFGQGSHTTFAQIAAEVLGAPLEDCEVTFPDTDRTPFSLGPWGTRITIGGGWAVKLAAEDARNQVLAVAAEMLGTDPGYLQTAEGWVFIEGDRSRGVSLGEVAGYALYRANGRLIVGQGTHEPATDPSDPAKLGSPCSAWSFAACTAEVEVDPRTGRVEILDLACVVDAGTIINPLNARGQVEGQVLEAVGFALYEEMTYKQGILVNPGLLNAGTPSVYQRVPVKVLFTDSYDPNCPFGAKGLAEVAGPAAFGAVVNAVKKATGSRFTELPLTPEKILRALERRALEQRTSEHGALEDRKPRGGGQ